MPDTKNKVLAQAKMPSAAETQKKLDNWLHENINMPLHKRGFENTGAALSAFLSEAGSMYIPEDMADLAIGLVPGAKILKAGKKGMKLLKKVDDPVADVLKKTEKQFEELPGSKHLKRLRALEAAEQAEKAGKSGERALNMQEILAADKARRVQELERKAPVAEKIIFGKKGAEKVIPRKKPGSE